MGMLIAFSDSKTILIVEKGPAKFMLLVNGVAFIAALDILRYTRSLARILKH